MSKELKSERDKKEEQELIIAADSALSTLKKIKERIKKRK